MKLFVMSFAPGVGYSVRNRRDWWQVVLGGVMTLVLSISFLAVILAGVIFVEALNQPQIITLTPTSGVVEIPAHINARHAVIMDVEGMANVHGAAGMGDGWLDTFRPATKAGRAMDIVTGF